MADNELEKYLDETAYESRDKIQMLLFSGLDDKQVERINEYINQNRSLLYQNVDSKNYCLTPIRNLENVSEKYRNSFSDKTKSIETDSSKYILMGDKDFLSKLMESVGNINIFSYDKDVKYAFDNIENLPEQDRNAEISNSEKDGPEKNIDSRTVITSKEAKELNTKYKSMRISNVNKEQMAALLSYSEIHGYGMSFNPQDNVVNIYAKTETELEKRTIDVSYFLLKYDEMYGRRHDEIEKKEREVEANKDTGPVEYSDQSNMDIASIIGVNALSYMLIAKQVEEIDRGSQLNLADKSIGDLRNDLRNSKSNIEISKDGKSLRNLIEEAKEESERENAKYYYDRSKGEIRDIEEEERDR